MSRFFRFAIGLGILAVRCSASAQEVPWLFSNGTMDVGAIIDLDGDGPDPDDDCYFKVTGIPGFAGTYTLELVDSQGESCSSFFPCTGTFELNSGVNAVIEFEDCESGSVEGFSVTFFRPGPIVPSNALLSPNTAEIPMGKGQTVGGLLCDSNGPAVLVSQFGMNILFSLSFFPDATNPQFLVVPMLGGKLVGGGSHDVYIPLVNGKATIASQASPSTTAVELDLGGLCDCSLGGVCPAVAPPAAAAPVVGSAGLAAVAFTLLAIGAWAMRRRPGFARSLPLP